MARAISVWIVSDQKAGHENQSLGLVDALKRLLDVESKLVRVDPKRSAWRNSKTLLAMVREERNPDLLVGAGHRTHWILLLMRWIRRIPVVVLMKPSIPIQFFDLCLIPEHDLQNRKPGNNVIPTCGVLNRVRYQPEKQNDSGLILIGGPCREFGWDEGTLTSAVVDIVRSRPGIQWTLTDSRRTPEAFLSTLRAQGLDLELWSHHDTPAGWLPDRLAEAGTVWATQDSVSMIYESLSSGASVGLLKMPPTGSPSRLSYGIERLVDTGMVTRYRGADLTAQLPAPSRVLAETDRCAAVIRDTFFKDRVGKGQGE